MNATGHDEEISSAIMEVALSLDDPDARHAFLERVFENRQEAKREMATLLEAATGAATFFLEAREERAKVTATILSETRPASSLPARFIDEEGMPEKLGPYRLIRRLGEGGGGVVYEAEQEQPIRRRVALKIVRMDAESPSACRSISKRAKALGLSASMRTIFRATRRRMGCCCSAS